MHQKPPIMSKKQESIVWRAKENQQARSVIARLHLAQQQRVHRECHVWSPAYQTRLILGSSSSKLRLLWESMQQSRWEIPTSVRQPPVQKDLRLREVCSSIPLTSRSAPSYATRSQFRVPEPLQTQKQVPQGVRWASPNQAQVHTDHQKKAQGEERKAWIKSAPTRCCNEGRRLSWKDH